MPWRAVTMFQAFTMLHADSAMFHKVRLSRAASAATAVSASDFLLPRRLKLTPPLALSHTQEWPSAKSSVPKEIADAKEDKCAMCTATDPTTY